MLERLSVGTVICFVLLQLPTVPALGQNRPLEEDNLFLRAQAYAHAMREHGCDRYGAYRLSGDGKYLRKSEGLADLAIENLFDDGIAFPHATQWKDRFPYYASISYGDSLMLMFLELALLRNGRGADVERLGLQCSIQ